MLNTDYYVFSGLNFIHKLESLSLAHNLLDSEAIASGGIALLHDLKRLDLSHNLLTQVPPVISNMKRLVIIFRTYMNKVCNAN